MIKILANDGLASVGVNMLTEAGIKISLDRIPQEKLIDEINKEKYDAILVRSTTKLNREFIEKCPTVKLIARVGAATDNIDVEYALEKGIKVLSTPMESAPSVAELAFAHLFSLSRKLFASNRNLPQGNNFHELKQKYNQGIELQNKTLGIIGFGRVGQEVAKRALGLGMNVIATDPFVADATLKLLIPNYQDIYISMRTVNQEQVLKNSDFITLHLPLPFNKKPIINKEQIDLMKDGVILINVSKGDLINEDDVIDALDSGKIAGAGIDAFSNEPHPNEKLLKHLNVSVTPHLGGATIEAQERISITLAKELIKFFNK